MLDEQEYAAVSRIYGAAVRATKEYRKKYGVPLAKCSMDERFRPVCDEYERITGFKETNHNAVMHHRIQLYGPTCPGCARPLRTPKARFCAECGRKGE